MNLGDIEFVWGVKETVDLRSEVGVGEGGVTGMFDILLSRGVVGRGDFGGGGGGTGVAEREACRDETSKVVAIWSCATPGVPNAEVSQSMTWEFEILTVCPDGGELRGGRGGLSPVSSDSSVVALDDEYIFP